MYACIGILALRPAQLSAEKINQNTWGSPITIETKDGVILSAIYQKPKKTNRPTWILLHGLGSVKEEWKPFAKLLSKQGYGYLAFDLRGHGESIKTKSGGAIFYQEFRTEGEGSQWFAMISDAGVIVKFLKDKKTPVNSIYLVGASIGANITINYAASNPAIKTVVLFSPGLKYAGGLTTPEAVNAYKGTVIIGVSEGDQYAYYSSLQLQAQNPSIKLLTKPGTAHGVNLFDGKWELQILSALAR